MIERPRHYRRLRSLLEQYPIVAVLGARQVGKTTLARALVTNTTVPVKFFDLENPTDQARLQEPMLALGSLDGYVVLDEAQLRPDIFPVLRVLADRPAGKTRFLILGSASPDLIRQSSQSLAGRVALYELNGFDLDEVGSTQIESLWLRGGFPRAFLATSDSTSFEWRQNFARTFLERDLPQLGISIPARTLRRFWTMLAHVHGQVWNASEFARAFGVSDSTVRRYLDILTSTFVVRLLLPWFENIGKRQVKSPKIYFTDSGILHALLNIRTMDDLETHPRLGASWEGFALQEVIARLGAAPEECFFWATHAGAELDLLVTRGKLRLGFEVKRTLAPTVTPSMRAALQDLHLDRLYVVYAGQESFPMSAQIDALPCQNIWSELNPL